MVVELCEGGSWSVFDEYWMVLYTIIHIWICKEYVQFENRWVLNISVWCHCVYWWWSSAAVPPPTENNNNSPINSALRCNCPGRSRSGVQFSSAFPFSHLFCKHWLANNRSSVLQACKQNVFVICALVICRCSSHFVGVVCKAWMSPSAS